MSGVAVYSTGYSVKAWMLFGAGAFVLLGCAPSSNQTISPTQANPVRTLIAAPPQTTEAANDQLRQLGHNWFFGPGVGRTMLNVGTVVAFPPFALYLLGNAGLTLAGYEPLSVTQVLPTPVGEAIDSVYDSTTSLPGRFNAVILDEEYRP